MGLKNCLNRKLSEAGQNTSETNSFLWVWHQPWLLNDIWYMKNVRGGVGWRRFPVMFRFLRETRMKLFIQCYELNSVVKGIGVRQCIYSCPWLGKILVSLMDFNF